MTDRTASRSDARKRRPSEIVRDLIADPPAVPTCPTDQENPMTAKTRHDELVALLNKISEESVTASNVLADVLDLLRDRRRDR